MVPESPIFIHSLFRAGSTYLFNCFRRSFNGYWCYQEPLNEYLLNLAVKPGALLELHDDNVRHLRHPDIGRPYFYEFLPLANWIADSFRSEFSYRGYFSDDLSEALCSYLSGLLAGAQGRAVFQECRSPGRVSAIRRCLGGKHLFLWRNPWDQWWSYKVDSHFEMCNLQILAADHAPPVFLELRKHLNFAPRGGEAEHFIGQRLDAEGSYTLFFALWCHAMLEARPQCDFDISIDSLSSDENYRKVLLERLASHGLTGLDFSDCAIPVSVYGDDDRMFFAGVENYVFGLFKNYGYSARELEELRYLIEKPRGAHGDSWTADEVGCELGRLRQLARRVESELAASQREGDHRLAAFCSKEAERAVVEKALWDKEAERAAVEKALWDKEAERAVVEKALWEKEAERAAVEKALWDKEAERGVVEKALWEKEAERAAVEKALWDKETELTTVKKALRDTEVERVSADSALWKMEAERSALASTLDAKEKELSQILSSRYWRFGKSIRMLESRIFKWLRHIRALTL